MKPAAFRYHRPRTLDDALALLAEHQEQARPIAGGQSLVPMMNLRMAQPTEIIDLAAIEALRRLNVGPQWIELGAMIRHHEVESAPSIRKEHPLLSHVAGTIGHYAIRQRGTIGGSLAHADPAAQWPLLAVTLPAQILVSGVNGNRQIDGSAFIQSLMTTALQPDELVTAVRFPCLGGNEGWSYQGFCRRSGDFAIVAVVATLLIANGIVQRMRLGIGGATPVPISLKELAKAQVGQPASTAWAHATGVQARAALEVTDDSRIPALFRQELIETLVTRALEECIARAT